MFDAKQMKAALEAPVFVDLEGGRHEGVVVSAPTMMSLYPDINRLAGDGFQLPRDWDELVAFVGRLCAAGFPGNDEIAEKLLALPAPIFTAAVLDILGFMKGQGKDDLTPPQE